jgi:hypothetical protein
VKRRFVLSQTGFLPDYGINPRTREATRFFKKNQPALLLLSVDPVSALGRRSHLINPACEPCFHFGRQPATQAEIVPGSPRKSHGTLDAHRHFAFISEGHKGTNNALKSRYILVESVLRKRHPSWHTAR